MATPAAARAIPANPAKKKVSTASVRRAFVTIVWPRRKLILVGLLLVGINRLCGLVLPASTKYLIDNVIAKHDLVMLRKLIGVVFAAILVQAATGFLLTRLMSIEAQRLISILRADIQKHIIRLPISYFDSTKTGALVSRIMNDVEGVRNLVGTGLVQLIGGIITASVALVLLIRMNAMMTLYALAPMVVFGFISMKAFAHIRPIFRRRGQINADVTGRLTETLGGIRVIKGFHAETQEYKVFAEGTDRIFQNVRDSLNATSLVTSLATLLMGVGSVLIMGFGGHMIIGGKMTIGEFVSFTLYLAFLVAPIVQMSNIGTQLTEAFAGLDRMEEILRMPAEGEEPGRTVTLDTLRGDISFDNVSFAYAEKEVLTDVSFEAAAGSVTALVGSSGSGKSTIAGLAASFRIPTRGVVRVDGHDLVTVKLESYRAHLAWCSRMNSSSKAPFATTFSLRGRMRARMKYSPPRARPTSPSSRTASTRGSTR
jgi:subfamily B ATP-binding cassette protein MsbA